ncbi:MAG: cyclomaltodextrinase C-terminal domain-containing protein [Bacteroidetes bacterium]|nr:cyclomaltodextrinase C-terminal domain-containing protein [Bacteroidota bacterium]
MRIFSFVFLLLCNGLLPASSQKLNFTLAHIDPPNWFTGLEQSDLQLLVRGENISAANFSTSYPGVSVKSIDTTQSKNYLVIHLSISSNTPPGSATLLFTKGRKKISAPFNFIAKPNRSTPSLSAADAIYLLMPDRFANSDKNNDRIAGMFDQTLNRDSFVYRHGGDLQGVISHLDYIRSLGFTAIWLNPVMENNQPTESYHGYACTNHYQVDKRLGGNKQYQILSEAAHQQGLKLVHDIVLNHIGNKHYLYIDPPYQDMFHNWSEFTRTTYKDGTLFDPYRAQSDYNLMRNGWFDTHMPDFNQHHPFVAKYLTQNSIWLIATFGIDAFRIDTYAYSDLQFESDWAKAIKAEFPAFFMFGETWVHGVVNQSFFTKNNLSNKEITSYTDGVTDFQLYYAINDAINQPFGWTEGINRVYHLLCSDIIYQNPFNNVTHLDNHDLSRYWSVCGKDLNKYKIGLTLLATLRGIPSIYYGTELLMENYANHNSSNVRQDFPGGWEGDTLDVFNRESLNKTLTRDQQEAFSFLTLLFNYRNQNKVLHDGKLKQFVPIDGVYAYFRYNDNAKVMVVINTNKKEAAIDGKRFSEIIDVNKTGIDIFSGKEVKLASMLLPAMSSQILELK